MMHTPTRQMDCYAATLPPPRPWMHMDLYRLQKLAASHPHFNAYQECRAFTSKENRIALQGDSCSDCARMPKEYR
jgi:hypothetical protein